MISTLAGLRTSIEDSRESQVAVAIAQDIREISSPDKIILLELTDDNGSGLATIRKHFTQEEQQQLAVGKIKSGTPGAIIFEDRADPIYLHALPKDLHIVLVTLNPALVDKYEQEVFMLTRFFQRSANLYNIAYGPAIRFNGLVRKLI